MAKKVDCKEMQTHGIDVFSGAAYLNSTNVINQLGKTRDIHVVYVTVAIPTRQEHSGLSTEIPYLHALEF
jgi:hypothetical protein